MSHPGPEVVRPSSLESQGMILIPGGLFTMRIHHPLREPGCYPDPGVRPESYTFPYAPEEDVWAGERQFRGYDEVEHCWGPMELAPFWMDEYEVTNREFAAFAEATGYQPRCPDNFLRHWSGRQPPGELADHPVVYIDLEDARAYAAWAGKRLPTEIEWQFAAQGTDGRRWPWGNDFDAGRCNGVGPSTTLVSAYPGGASPFGVKDLCGNVWEMVDSEWDDSHTRFVILRGGSHFAAEGSKWYFAGGPRPNDFHAKLLLMHPGLDRCATVGFRCARSADGR